MQVLVDFLGVHLTALWGIINIDVVVVTFLLLFVLFYHLLYGIHTTLCLHLVGILVQHFPVLFFLLFVLLARLLVAWLIFPFSLALIPRVF